MKATAFLTLLLVLFPGQLYSQYWGERVLEKSFEQTDFFFTPSYLSPYGIGGFKATTPGLIRDPLLDIMLNPARLSLDSLSENYLYTDFRSSRNVKENETGFYPPWIALADRTTMDVAYYPHFYLNMRKELEPVFSGAYIGRPLPLAVRDLIVGITYQLVMQDEKYYDVPQDIYKTAAGYDYNGMRAAAASSIPIVDRYSGQDNMHQAGHFVSGFVRYPLPAGIEVGAKISRVFFGRDGSFGSSNLWQYSPYSQGSSLWSNLEAREQSYAHWELAGGLRYRITNETTIGATVGHIWGDANQSLRNNDSSYYSYSSIPSASFYNRSGNTLSEWRHAGRSTSLGLDVSSHVGPSSVLTLVYQHQGTTVDLGLGSSILDTSYSTYAWSNNGVPVTSYSQSYLNDSRLGTGTQKVTIDRLLGSVQWEIDAKVSLSIGALLEWQRTETNTAEGVLLHNRSAYWSTDNSWNYTYGGDESKDLLWTFSAQRSSFQVPVFVTVKAAESLELLFGLNRNMSQWKVDDVTLALFRYRQSMNNGVITRNENFGERYTQPPEEVTDVRTTFLAGLTVAPSQKLRIRLLMVPNFRDTLQGSELEQMQWWLGVTLKP
jgi:hypothetical protein